MSIDLLAGLGSLPTDMLTDWPAARPTGRMVETSVARLPCCMGGWLGGMPVGVLSCLCTSLLVDGTTRYYTLVSWADVWLDGWLAGWYVFEPPPPDYFTPVSIVTVAIFDQFVVAIIPFRSP